MIRWCVTIQLYEIRNWRLYYEEKGYFKIGELSKLFDIGVDSIRYYEKVGILHPVRNDENNYRMYTIDDVRRLALIRELLRLSFSTDQIREYDEDRNVDSTTSLLRAELDVVDAEIANSKPPGTVSRTGWTPSHPFAARIYRMNLRLL